MGISGLERWEFNPNNPTVNITALENQTYALSYFGIGWTTYGPKKNGNLGAPLSGLFTPLSPDGGYSVMTTLDL